MSQRTAKKELRNSWWRPSISGGFIWVIFYIGVILAVHFDIRGHGKWFQHPVAWEKSAWIALLLVALVIIADKVRDRIKGVK